MSQEQDCLFCGILAGTIPSEVIYENDDVIAFRDVAPQAPTHVLVGPRRHVENAGTLTEEDADLVGALILGAQRVAELEGSENPDRGYRLVMNVGADAMNSVPHLHLHVLGGRALTWPPG